jgi:hypothetical protein
MVWSEIPFLGLSRSCKPNHMGNGIQSAIALSDKAGKKKPTKNFSDTLWVKSQKVFLFLDNIGHTRWNIIKITISHSHNALCDDCTTVTWCPCDGSTKIEKLKKTKKRVFLKFLTRVKSNMCKKWGVGSTYTLL